ncbi:right-handed parallel beta-helix repeat-containing protein [Stakelama saccharophila]|uniref:Right-handed parallel beta-helix repeat-containing protein n=1 Tax=Stakelama saccharophila TaxID=3075605 RepID=A0ABZ0B7S7_9SPHN|nr:right-handed parallel beta-helix repeat-containing protein [Stakelama sp. W311]WNO52404.1 right-handed parallel beta-helix repeat-containing protein [Stakelama sp. W311]
MKSIRHLLLAKAFLCTIAVAHAQSASIEIHVAPNGDDAATGTADHPVRTLAQAQKLVRARNADRDVTVILADGTYSLSAPLVFRQDDGGNGHLVIWRAANGAHPVLSGGIAVTDWRPSRAGKGIWEADIPRGIDSRQLWVNDHLAEMARTELPRSAVRFSETGIIINDDRLPDLASLPQQDRIEVEGTGYFTDRFSPVARVERRTLVMQQPAWGNNNWGYDTLAKPYGPEYARLYLRNSLAFLDAPNEWFLDPDQGKLYYRPAAGTDMASAKVMLPRLDHLISISGSYEKPVRDLRFEGLRFSYTSWMGPSTDQGYANQQSGAFLAGPLDARPGDALETCSWGCPGFETRRNEWSQIPAAVQVSAAERITFARNIFAHLGQVALGIGNNADANASGVGLGAHAIEVSGNVFTDLAAGAILAGGVRRDAHHPSERGQANRQVLIQNNRIHKVSQDYMDNSAILSTYVDRALILHNDISDAPYDGIDIGWGWGMNDPGGNPAYRIRERGYYDYPANLVYTEPTTHRDVMVAYNRLHAIKTHYEDGGAIYNLSASPDTVIAENYVYDIPDHIALYLDEGSRYITVRDNVVKGARLWLNVNTVKSFFPQRISPDNKAVGNWHDTTETGGMWTTYQNNLILDDHLVTDGNWPAAAQRVMANAGVEESANLPDYPLDGATE